MQNNLFDKSKIKTKPLSERESLLNIEEIVVNPCAEPPLSENSELIKKIAEEIISSRKNNKPVIIAFGAHLIKSGLSRVLIELINHDYVTHLATNGAGSIHDWEFAFQGSSTESVRKYVHQGQFGIWEETGKYINLAIIKGAEKNLGYGESIGRLIFEDKIEKQKVNHPFKKFSVQSTAYEKNIPFTVHPGFGYDIIYTHPLSDGASIGKTSEIDFLKFVDSVLGLEGGIYISIGSAIMSPMIFEKAISMARNVAHQENKKITDFMIVVNDIQEGNWDWNSEKEPSKDNPAYYLRFCKTFHRMGAREMHYVKEDNKSFLMNLYHELQNASL